VQNERPSFTHISAFRFVLCVGQALAAIALTPGAVRQPAISPTPRQSEPAAPSGRKSNRRNRSTTPGASIPHASISKTKSRASDPAFESSASLPGW